MSSPDNISVVRRFYELLQDYWRTGNADALDEVVSPTATVRIPGFPPVFAAAKQVLPVFRSALPDMKFTVHTVFAEGDLVVDRVTWTGTNAGEMMGLPATGKVLTVSELHLTRVSNGRIVERSGNWGQLEMLQQMGVVPQLG